MCRSLFVTVLICAIFTVARSTCMQNFYWRDYSHGQIPYDALEVSPGLYVGQVYLKDAIVPAAIYPFRNTAIAMFGPRVDVEKHVKILCTPEPEKFYLEQVNFNIVNMTLMKDAVVAGYQEGSLRLYIGLVFHLGSWKIGKVFDVEVTSWEGVYVWSNTGERVIFKEFQLLKYDSSGNGYPLKHELQ